MLSTFKLSNLTAEKLSYINQVYDDVDLRPGVMSQSFNQKEIKNNLQMDFNDPYQIKCKKIILDSISNERLFYSYTFYQEISDLIFSEYREGMYYNLHNDSPQMGKIRTDISCTIFLNDPEEYDGGELFLGMDSTSDKGISYKMKAGECILYNTGIPHRVNPVTKGKRRVCVFWIQSNIKDNEFRRILSSFDDMLYDRADEWYKTDPDLAHKMGEIYYTLKRKISQQ